MKSYSFPAFDRWYFYRKRFILSCSGWCHDKFVTLYVSRSPITNHRESSYRFFFRSIKNLLSVSIYSLPPSLPLDKRNASNVENEFYLSFSKYYQNISQLKNFNLSGIEIFFPRERGGGRAGETRDSINFHSFRNSSKKIRHDFSKRYFLRTSEF